MRAPKQEGTRCSLRRARKRTGCCARFSVEHTAGVRERSAAERGDYGSLATEHIIDAAIRAIPSYRECGLERG